MKKRVFDLALIFVTSPIWMVLLLLSVTVVLISMGMPVFYIDERSGLLGKPFKMIKIRTMRSGNQPDSERLTGVGKILRALSLDELPELWNIIKGEMSLVGPRPLPIRYLPRYSSNQRRRLNVLPGLTGLAQVKGRNALDWETKFDYDVYYVDHHSLWMDMRIIFLTIFKVFLPTDINHPGEATMSEFKGEENG